MKRRKELRIAVACLFLLATVTALPAGEKAKAETYQTSFAVEEEQQHSSHWVKVVRSGAVATKDGPTLQVVILNVHETKLWVTVDFDKKKKDDPCEQTLSLQAGTSHQYECPVKSLEPRKTYRAYLRVFRKEGRRQPVDQFTVSYKFTEEEVVALMREPS